MPKDDKAHETVVIDLERPVELTADDGKKIFLPAGQSAQPVAIAEHWYVKAHMKPEPPPGPGSFEWARAKRARADELREVADAAEAEAAEAEAQHAATAVPADDAAAAEGAQGEDVSKEAPEEEAAQAPARAVVKPRVVTKKAD